MGWDQGFSNCSKRWGEILLSEGGIGNFTGGWCGFFYRVKGT